MAYKIWLFLWYFVLASFCGWVAEVGYIGMVYRKFKNPGMLNGPYCPQYGLMIALPWAALTALHWQTSFVATLFFCLISSFLVEFTFALLLRKTTHIRLRDYSKFKWNIKGYVSVPVATVRGVCFSFIVVFIVPVLTSLLHYVNRTVGWVILYAVLGIMLLDIIITSITVQRLNHQFKRLSELGDRVREARNALGNAVTGGAIGAAEAIDDLDLQKKLQEAQKTADENYTALLNKSNFLKRRFMSASPDMTNEQYEKELKAYRITTEERKKRSAERWKRNRYEYEATFENPEDRPFAFGMNFTKLFWIFFIGCLAGFVLEECWAFFIAHQIELRVGLVYGPFQPIYGGGAAIITLCLYKLYKQDDIVIFVASGTGIYGSIVSGMTGDHSIMIAKSILDLFTAIIFSCTLGSVVSLIAIPQFILFMTLFLLAGVIYPLTTPAMINDFKAVGGFFMLAAGFRMNKVTNFPTADMIPAMILIMPFSWIWSSFILPLVS